MAQKQLAISIPFETTSHENASPVPNSTASSTLLSAVSVAQVPALANLSDSGVTSPHSDSVYASDEDGVGKKTPRKLTSKSRNLSQMSQEMEEDDEEETVPRSSPAHASSSSKYALTFSGPSAAALRAHPYKTSTKSFHAATTPGLAQMSPLSNSFPLKAMPSPLNLSASVAAAVQSSFSPSAAFVPQQSLLSNNSDPTSPTYSFVSSSQNVLHQCNQCGKVYKHRNCLHKHLWEHHDAWEVTKRLGCQTKHQQVQLLEAAQVLLEMTLPVDATATAV